MYSVGVMLKKIIQIISNPLLYYVDKSGNSVFRNYCLIKNTGNLYKTTIPKANVGKALEYRFQLDKYLKWTYFLTPVILYLIFIHVKFSLGSLLWFEFLWLLIVNGARILCSYLYSDFLIRNFGKYEVIEFKPPVPKRKIDEYVSFFKSKIIITIIIFMLFLLPAFLMQLGMKFSIGKHKKFKQGVNIANTYLAIYPKSQSIYDMRAYSRFMEKDYEGALADYKMVLSMSGKKFSKRDFVRFANLLYLQKKMSTPQEAVDVFNEYITQKKMSVLESSQMLWIKSIFKVENNIYEDVLQEYDDLLASLESKDYRNQFYISSDMAYVLYLMDEYSAAINTYNTLIAYAQSNTEFSNELSQLYAERGWAKKRAGDVNGANADFVSSQIPFGDLPQYEPTYSAQEFVVEKW